MERLLDGVLGVIEFLEFLTTPGGLVAGLWVSLYLFFIQILGLNILLAMLLPAIPAVDLYFLLKRLNF